MANEIVKKAAVDRCVKLWELADEVQISESTFYRHLRRELPDDRREALLEAIDRIAARRTGGDSYETTDDR